MHRVCYLGDLLNKSQRHLSLLNSECWKTSDFAYRWPPLVDDENAAQTGSVHAALLAVGVGMSFPCRQSPAAQKNHGGLWKYLQTLLTAVKPPRGLFRDSLGFFVLEKQISRIQSRNSSWFISPPELLVFSKCAVAERWQEFAALSVNLHIYDSEAASISCPCGFRVPPLYFMCTAQPW